MNVFQLVMEQCCETNKLNKNAARITGPLGMTQVKTTQAEAKSSEPSSVLELFTREVISMQCFHWLNTTTCGTYPCA